MASSSSHRSSRSNASSLHHFHQAPIHHTEPDPEDHDVTNIPIETLVEHLLAAKRSLSTMTAVVRANEICTAALLAYEESVVLSAETEYLRRGMARQLSVLARVKRSLNRTYDAGKKEFKQLIRMMDVADGKMRTTTTLLRERGVPREFREGEGDEGEKNLMDFVDEKSVLAVVDALKGSVKELQVCPTNSIPPTFFFFFFPTRDAD